MMFLNLSIWKIKGYLRLGIEKDGKDEFQDMASLPNCFGKIDLGEYYHILLNKYFFPTP